MANGEFNGFSIFLFEDEAGLSLNALVAQKLHQFVMAQQKG